MNQSTLTQGVDVRYKGFFSIDGLKKNPFKPIYSIEIGEDH